MNATEACIALNMLPTIGPVRLRKLLEVFQEPQRILAAKRGDLRKVEGIGNEVAEQISNWESTVDLPAELERIRDFGATVLTQQSPSYPPPLREIHAPPIVLYVWGELTGARSSRYRRDRLATHHPLRDGMGEEALLPTCLRRAHRHQRTGARHRYGCASGCARGERPHHRGDRLRLSQTLSAGERRRWRRKSAAGTAQSFPSSR